MVDKAGGPSVAFRHEAFLYAGPEQFLEGTVPFVEGSLRQDEPILVVVSAEKIKLMRGKLGADADRVHFADMSEVGSNPGRIIPAWHAFVEEHAASDRPLRGIGEPINPDRGLAELVECERHESLLNLAFADTPAFWLLCPYDTDALEPAVVEEALRNHPFAMEDGRQRESTSYRGLEAVAAPFREPLPEPSAQWHELPFETDDLGVLRRFVSLHAMDADLSIAKTADFVLAVNEVAANSVRHAGGYGVLRIWQEDEALVCEIRDSGHIDEPLAGRKRPSSTQEGGHGLWLANQLSDLVQLRTFATGSVVRVHMRRELLPL